MGLIDYGPHKLCTKHKHKIPELIKCVYCELEDVSTLDLADTLKIKQLEKERDELRDKVKWFDQVLSGNSKRLVSKIKSLYDEANKYLGRLQEAHEERDELKSFLSEARGELHRMMLAIPLKYQSKKFLGICQDIGYHEGGEETESPCPRCGKPFLYPSFRRSMAGCLSYCSEKCMEGGKG